MRGTGWTWLVAAIGLVALGAGPGGADARHSGTVLALGDPPATLTVAEVGPWTTRDGETVTVRRTFRLTADTRIVRAERRAEAAPGGWPGDFVEIPIPVGELRPGVFVTVEVEGAGARPAARKVTAVVPAEP